MEVMVYNAVKPRESLQEFNDRLREYCEQYDVGLIEASVVGPSIVVSFTLAEELSTPIAHCLIPVIDTISGTDAMLEEVIGERLTPFIPDPADDDPDLVPTLFQVLPRMDVPTEGFTILRLIRDTIILEDEDDE